MGTSEQCPINASLTFRHRTRVNYTVRDEQHLAQYLASIRPERDAGGLMGNKIYRDLVVLAEVIDKEYEWTRRHSWQSWRDHYKHNKARIHEFMDEYLMTSDPVPEKNEYFRDRRVKPQRVYVLEGKQEEEEEEEEEEIEGATQVEIPAPKDKGKQRVEEEEEEDEESDSEQPVPVQRKSRRRLVADEEPSTSVKHATATGGRPTQTTLVGSSPRSKSRSAPPTPRSPSPALPQDHDIAPLEDDLDAQPAAPSAPQPMEEQDAPAPVPQRPRPRPRIAKSTRPKRGTSVDTEPLAPQTTRRSKAPSPVPAEGAPYRNTRSRSRSVEPPAALPPRKTRKKPEVPLPPVTEQSEEEDLDELTTILWHNLSAASSVSVNDTRRSPVVNVESQQFQGEEELAEDELDLGPQLESDDSMDEDDSQTHQDLFTQREESPLFSQPSQDLRMALENVQKFNPKAAGSSGNRNPPPVTPQRRRRDSSDSSEQFPVPNTGAKQMVEQIQAQERASSYVPPSGSRAAWHLTQTTRANKRARR